MRHLTAQRICAVADAALRVLDEKTMKAAKAYILYQCDDAAMHSGSPSGVNFHLMATAFQPVIAAGKKTTFIARLAQLIANAKIEMAEIQESARAEWIVKKAAESNLIISAAAAREALANFDGDCDKTLSHLINHKPKEENPCGKITAQTCRAQAETFRRVGDTVLAEEWEKEAVRLDIITAGGNRETANAFLTQFGLHGALAAFIENRRGSIRYFQRSYEATKEEMEIAGANLEITPEVTKPHRLEAFEHARERHRIARIELITKARDHGQCHDPGIERVFNAALSGDYIPQDIEQRLMWFCLNLPDRA